MGEDLSHLTEYQEPEDQQQDRLTKLENAVERARNLKVKIEEKEEDLKTWKEKLRAVLNDEIPLLMGRTGKMLMADGTALEVKDDVSATIEKGQEEEFFKWLEENGHEDIIKYGLEVGKCGESDIEALIKAALAIGLEPDTKKDVHSGTRKKFFKELLGLGLEPKDYTEALENGEIMRKEDIPDFVKVSIFTYANIKEKKKNVRL